MKWGAPAMPRPKAPKPAAAFIIFFFKIPLFSTEKWGPGPPPLPKKWGDLAPPVPPSMVLILPPPFQNFWIRMQIAQIPINWPPVPGFMGFSPSRLISVPMTMILQQTMPKGLPLVLCPVRIWPAIHIHTSVVIQGSGQFSSNKSSFDQSMT